MKPSATSGIRQISGKSVLIVADDPELTNALAAVLRAAGHRASIVGDIARAAILAPLLRPDMAIVDADQPDCVGFARSLRELLEFSQCQCIALTDDATKGRQRIGNDPDPFAAWLAKSAAQIGVLHAISDSSLLDDEPQSGSA